ncbi:metallopeptidase family M24 [Apiospora arundinis]
MRTSNSLLFLSFSAGTSAASSLIHPQHGHIAPTCATVVLGIEHTVAFQDHFPSTITGTHAEVTSTSAVSSSASPTGWNPQPSTADENTRCLLLISLENARWRNRAKKCDDIEPDEFVEKATTFLSYWNTESAAQHDINEKAILERLAEYQIIYETMNTLYMQDAFPDYIVDQVRSVHQLVQEDDALTGANPRIIYGLDIVFNDICADT